MKELSKEEKAKAYDEALEYAMIYYKNGNENMKIIMKTCFPVLTEESEDERIRKAIINLVKKSNEYGGYALHKDEADKMIAWLEKQSEQKPNYCHHEVDLSNCSEEYRKAYYDGWNNCNMQHSQCRSELDDVIKCLINGMKFYYDDNKEATWGTDKWSMPVKHIIEVLEKQGEQKPADKVEPNQEWSEEDKNMLQSILDEYKSMTIEKRDWLKSLKDRYAWKPSDEQMKALNEAIYHVDDFVATQIAILIRELSKL